jgi:hypothetical protein
LNNQRTVQDTSHCKFSSQQAAIGRSALQQCIAVTCWRVLVLLVVVPLSRLSCRQQQVLDVMHSLGLVYEVSHLLLSFLQSMTEERSTVFFLILGDASETCQLLHFTES